MKKIVTKKCINEPQIVCVAEVYPLGVWINFFLFYIRYYIGRVGYKLRIKHDERNKLSCPVPIYTTSHC